MIEIKKIEYIIFKLGNKSKYSKILIPKNVCILSKDWKKIILLLILLQCLIKTAKWKL